MRSDEPCPTTSWVWDYGAEQRRHCPTCGQPSRVQKGSLSAQHRLPGPVVIPVRGEDRLVAGACGAVRFADVQKVAARDHMTAKHRPSVHDHAVGALGEVILCRYLGLPFECDSWRRGRRADVDAGGIEAEVRASYTWDRLKVRPDELWGRGGSPESRRPGAHPKHREHVRWWAVRIPGGSAEDAVLHAPDAEVAGWTSMAMLREWATAEPEDPGGWGPAYFLPYGLLRPCGT